MGRFSFIAKRLVTLVPLLVGIVFVVFLLLKITPGNPAREAVGLRASPQAVAQAAREMGLDQSVSRSIHPLSQRGDPREPRLLVQDEQPRDLGAQAAGADHSLADGDGRIALDPDFSPAGGHRRAETRWGRGPCGAGSIGVRALHADLLGWDHADHDHRAADRSVSGRRVRPAASSDTCAASLCLH